VNSPSFFEVTPLSVVLTGGVLALLVLGFAAVFLVPGVLHWFRLVAIQRSIATFETTNFTAEFRQVFCGDKRLAHLWKEYQDSLHFQREERDGQMLVKAVRATVPAEVYFNSQVVVDSRLGTEFFKHLPGLFTGIGIIGTFTGLIEGLKAFQGSFSADENTVAVRSGLGLLMAAVGQAFLVSVSAITAAMVVTFLEKLLLASLYRLTEEIAHAIDARFDSGAGEEYLSRLVDASEESASQSKILKDALVKEMGELLRELTAAQIASSKEAQTQLAERLALASRQQVAAAREDNLALSSSIAESIRLSLEGPLLAIAKAVHVASGEQTDSATLKLEQVMQTFSTRLSDLFGGQITGLSELNQATAQGVQEAVGALQTLVANMEDSSKRSSDTMAERMAQVVEKMEARQHAMDRQSAASADTVGERMAQAIEKMEAHQQAMNKQSASSTDTMAERIAQVIEKMEARQQAMDMQSVSSTDTMADRMAQAIEKMEARQEVMNAQSASFVEQIRQLVASSQSETSQKLQSTLEALGTQVAGMLAALSASQTSVFEDNRTREDSMTERARSAVDGMTQSVESALKEMSAASTLMAQNVAVLTQTTSASVDKMNAGAEQLGTASRNFAAAGERVTGVMTQAATVTANLSETAGALTSGASALHELLHDYKTQRDAVTLMVTELRSTTELARREASLTGDILARIEGSATRLATAQKQADEYLDGVSRVLGEAHTVFATEVKRTLDKANMEFHTKLGSAVGMLSAGVSELELTLASMGNLTLARA